MIDRATLTRLNAVAKARTPAVQQVERDAIEAEFQREAAWRKEQSQSNVLRWYVMRKSRGQGK